MKLWLADAGPATSWSSCPASARSAKRCRGTCASTWRPGVRGGPQAEILPLFARLSQAEQDRVFEAGNGQRRIVLATNVAETSLTVPGIRYVIDPGTGARQALQLPQQGRAAADRAGQPGGGQPARRPLRPGQPTASASVCTTRRASRERPRFTDPEILRSSLAGCDPAHEVAAPGAGRGLPVPRATAAQGRRRRLRSCCQELGAVDDLNNQITDIGRQLARLPLDPRVGRMILEATQPPGARRGADHRRGALRPGRARPPHGARNRRPTRSTSLFDDEKSEFMGYLKLWKWIEEGQGRPWRNRLPGKPRPKRTS